MFKSLKLWNFQAHRQLEIEFAPGITTIKGPTDVGKSAILRAVRWVCLNDLGGEDFITWGRKEVVADLVLDSGRVSRRKGKENVYKLNGQIFRAIAAGKVPDTISVVLGVNEINFQRQLDAHFWLAESAPEVSRQLNRVIDLAVIDESLGKMAAFVRTARERVSLTEERLAEKRVRWETVKSGTKRIERFTLLSQRQDRYEKTQQDYDQLEGIIRSFNSYPVAVLEKKVAYSAYLSGVSNQLWKIEQKLFSLKKIIDFMETAQAAAVSLPSFMPIAVAWEKFRNIETERHSLIDLEGRVMTVSKRVLEGQKLCREAWNILAKHACPMCGRKN